MPIRTSVRTKSVFAVLFLTLLGASWLAADGPYGAPGEIWRTRLHEAMERAAREHPDLQSMEAHIVAARHRVNQATALPDPEVELGIKDVPRSDLSLTRDNFTMEMVTARQRFPGLGKRAATRDVASAEVGSLVAEHDRHVAAVRADVADVFFQLAALDRRLTILRETKSRLGDAAASARERYTVGKVSQADVLRANLETTSVEERILSLAAGRRVLVARFNSLQALPPDTAVPEIVGVEPEADLAVLTHLARRAVERAPGVLAAEAQVRKAEHELTQARLERHPDLMVMGYYGHRARFEDLMGASVAFNLPFAHPRRLDERRAETGAMLTASRAALSSAKNDLGSEVESALADLSKNLETRRLYCDSILPQAEINFRAAHEAYAVGQIDFLTFVRSATDLAMYQADEAERAAGVGRALASLQKALGLDFVEGHAALEREADEKH